ncbi:MAG: c-type cytochrome [Candidatus Thiodiazotropha sp.]
MSKLRLKQIVFLWAVAASANAGWESADLERSESMNLTPDYQRGKAIYNACAVCHMPEGWGTPNGAYPQIAGQHRTVTIKQLADIRAKNRDNPSMYAFAIDDVIGGPQAIADVAYYIETLKMTGATGKGDGKQLEYGKKLYQQYCIACHGAQGEGSSEQAYPAIHAQHYNYLLRQLIWLQNGMRRNGNSEMAEIIKGLDKRAFMALSDYISRMQPLYQKHSRHSWKEPGMQER